VKPNAGLTLTGFGFFIELRLVFLCEQLLKRRFKQFQPVFLQGLNQSKSKGPGSNYFC
jgi:hypothetical protein